VTNVGGKLRNEGLEVTLVQFLMMEDSSGQGYLYDQ